MNDPSEGTHRSAPPRNKGGRPRKRPTAEAVVVGAVASAPPRAGTALSPEDIAAIAAQVAQVMAKMQGEPARRVVPPPRVGATRPAADEEDFDPLDPKVQRAARERLHGGQAEVPRAEGLSDEEVLAMYQAEELGEFEVPLEMVPPGMALGWKLKSVRGQEDKSSEAELYRRGWTNVNHEDMPGCFGLRGETGPIYKKGLQLMKRPAELDELRHRYFRLLAKQAVRDKIAQMSSAPPGTGPRTHKDVAPRIKRTYEPLPVDAG